MNDIDEVMEGQIQQQGAACVRVKDGYVFEFTEETIRRLLESAKGKGRVVVFVKHGAES